MVKKPNIIPRFPANLFAGLSILMACSPGPKNPENNTADIAVLINKAAAKSQGGDRLAPIRYLDSALTNRKLTLQEKIEIYGFRSDIYNNQLRQYDKAMLYADSMLALVHEAGKEKYKTEYALANYAKGDVLFNQQRYDVAYSYYYAGRSAGKIHLDSCALAEYSFRLGVVLFRQSRFPEAAKIFQASYGESEACAFNFGKYFRRQQVLNNIGLSFYKAGNTDSALYYYNKGLQFVNQHGNEFPDRESLNETARAVFYGNIADILRIKGDTATAKFLLRKSVDINGRPGFDNRDAQYSQVKLAEIYFNEGHTDSMRQALQALRHSLDTVGNTRAEMDWNRLMWKFFDRKNDVKSAYHHLIKYMVFQDSLEKETDPIRLSDLSNQINMLESQYEIRTLQKENELKKVYLWIAVLASVSGGLIVFFILRNLLRSKKNVALLQSLNTQVNEQKLELQRALTTVEEKNSQQDRILRAVAHDLRGPVATIAMLIDLIEREEDPASKKEMIGFVKTSCNNSLQLIAEILEAADQSKKRELEKAPVNLGSLADETIQLLRMKAAEKQQVIKCAFPDNDVVVMANADKIKRVINNLVTNAIKFSPRGGAIALSLEAQAEGALLTVADNGIGIPPEISDKVFDMFTEAKRKGTAGELPYGLGLSICRQIVEAHNGRIWFESMPGEGTRFFVLLPY